jgi:CheY-like chemotaxis protein
MLFGEEPAAAVAEKAKAPHVEPEAEKGKAEKAEAETVETTAEPEAEPVPEQVAEPTTEAEEPVFRFEPVVIEPSHPVDEAAAEEPQAEPVEAAEHYEVPVETPAEPRPSIWETEPSELAPTVTSDQREPELVSSPFDTGLAEAVPAEAHGGTPDFGIPGPGGDRGNLVIIEDDPGVADYYATLFRGNGYNVHVANDGMSGVDLCTKLLPQVILLDVMMPRQNGMLVLQTLRATDETKDTPVVVLSNFSEPTLVKRALQLGALEYVIKTQVEGAALLEAMPRWMNREKAFAAA